MIELNIALSIVVLFLGLLVVRAYAPHMSLLRVADPVSWLARGFVMLNAAFILRTFYWDVIWWWIGNTPSDPSVNIWLNLGVVFSQLCALKARHLAIPQNERGRFNIFTCAFYPKTLRVRFWKEK